MKTNNCQVGMHIHTTASDCYGEFNNRTIGAPKVNLDKLKLNFIKII